MGEAYISATVPVRLIGSHGVNVRGFAAVRHGFFATPVAAPATGETTFVERFSAADITVLGVGVSSFTIADPAGGWQILEVVFREEQTADDIDAFLRRLADVLTASYAQEQRNPLYGNLVMEVGWSSMKLGKALGPGTSASLGNDMPISMTSEDRQVLTARKLEALADSDLTAVFVEGMRANRPKAKYISWFVTIEELERLAADPEFSPLFTPIFPEAGREAIVKASGLTGKQLNRLKALLCDPRVTVENRQEKLCKLLAAIGITEVPAPETRVPVNAALCQRLIKNRNHAAHRGAKVDEDLLYNVLFPLSCLVMGYLDARSTRARPRMSSIAPTTRSRLTA